MARRIVTEDEKLEFRRLYVEERLSKDEISAKVGRSAATIANHLHALGVPMRSPGTRRASSRRGIKRHGMSTHPHYWTWHSMMKRCYQSEECEYRDYGGRGIEVFGPWHNPRVYIEYVETILGPKPDDGQRWSINRIDNNDNYKPGNIRWDPWDEQMRNRDFTRNA